MHAIPLKERSRQCRTLLLANGWQLRLVADEHHPTVLSIIHELHQIVQQTSAAERPSRIAPIRIRIVGDHRGLINDKQGILVEVVVETESREITSRFLSVDTSMDGIGRMTRIKREHLRSATRGRQQHQFLLQCHHRLDDGCRQRGLSRSCRSTQNHHHMV